MQSQVSFNQIDIKYLTSTSPIRSCDLERSATETDRTHLWQLPWPIINYAPPVSDSKQRMLSSEDGFARHTYVGASSEAVARHPESELSAS
jgi:hypothetical protein